jgi:nucleotide-binding universal stress UspA family protein
MQGPPRKILLATDLSARCDRALDRALCLAAEWKAEVVAVHVLPEADPLLRGSTDTFPSWRRTLDPRGLAESRIRADLRELSSDIVIVVESGDPADAVLRAARTHGCGLIVTGVARNELLGRIALGTTVTQLSRHSEIPILVVRKRGRRPYARVVVATDFSESSRHALEAAVRFFPHRRLSLFSAYDAPLSLMASDPASHRAQFREAAERDGEVFLKASDLTGWTGGKPELVVEYGEPGQLLDEYVTEKAIDVVALGTHGRSAIFHALIGSVARSLIESLPCDVLVVREPRAGT